MTAQQTSPPALRTNDDAPTTIAGVVEMVTEYAKQETVGPLKGAATWLMWGAIGALCFAIGLSMVVLGVLRLVQTEWGYARRGSLSWVPYLIALIVAGGFAAIAFLRINRDSLNKEPN